jgi:integrase/recombinase XerC
MSAWVGGPASSTADPAIVQSMTLTQTWTDALDEWLTSLRAGGQSSTTLRTRRQHVAQFARNGGHDDPFTVTGDELIAWLGANTWKPETRYGHVGSLRSFYAWARHRSFVQTDPARELPKIRRTPPRARPLPDDHAAAALGVCDEREALMIRLAGEHGLRRAEIAVVHTRDVTHDLLGYSLTVHGKGGRIRYVPLADDVADAILDAAGYAFPGKIDGHLSPWWVGKLVARLLPAGWATHTLRHRFATVTYAKDHDVFAVQELLGHASPATTLRYVALPDDAKRRLVDASRFRIPESDIRPQTSRYVVSHLPMKGTA